MYFNPCGVDYKYFWYTHGFLYFKDQINAISCIAYLQFNISIWIEELKDLGSKAVPYTCLYRFLKTYSTSNETFIKTVLCKTNSDTQQSRHGPRILLPVISRENKRLKNVDLLLKLRIFDIVVN